MAADDNIAGQIGFYAGKTFNTARKIGSSIDSSQIDNAVGSKAVTIAPGGKVTEYVTNDSVIINFPPGPHVMEGENLYITVDPTTNAKAFDSTGATSDVLKFRYFFSDPASKTAEHRRVDSETDRNTTLLDGGLTDDMTVYRGRDNAVYAFKLCPPGTTATLNGHVQIDLRTTA